MYCAVFLLLSWLIALCLFSWTFFVGNKSYSGSIQSLTSIGSKESPKAIPNPELPPKMCRRLRLDTASSNGYQRPGSVWVRTCLYSLCLLMVQRDLVCTRRIWGFYS
jgi:hypothetical protein